MVTGFDNREILFMKNIKILSYAIVVLLMITSKANAEIILLQPNDFVGITFWLASLGMLAATIFFFIERGTITASWKLPITVAGLITGVAFIHSMYMRNIWVQTGDVPTLYRYIEWIITFPLLAVQFYLILSAVRKVPTLMFWRLLAAGLVMTISQYLGESGYLQSFIAFVIGMIGWIFILFEIFAGEASKICARSSNRSLVKAYGTMKMIVAVGWSIYPLGYIFGYLTGGVDPGVLNIIYNLADFVNKIAFGVIIWVAAMGNTSLSRR